MSSDMLKRVSDELAVREVLARYCRAIDCCDMDLLKSVYWPEATDDHVVFSGNAMAFAALAIPLLDEQTECTWHSISNIWIKLKATPPASRRTAWRITVSAPLTPS